MESLWQKIQENEENLEAEKRLITLWKVSMRFMQKLWLRQIFLRIIIQDSSIRHRMWYKENIFWWSLILRVKYTSARGSNGLAVWQKSLRLIGELLTVQHAALDSRTVLWTVIATCRVSYLSKIWIINKYLQAPWNSYIGKNA